MRILVAEDDAALREVLVLGLEDNGYRVDAVERGDDAIDQLKFYEYDVAVIARAASRIAPLAGAGRSRAPSLRAASACPASSRFICSTIARVRVSLWLSRSR